MSLTGRLARLTVLAAATCAPAPLLAAIPPTVEAMLREAVRSGDGATVDAVVKVAKATNPESAEEIGALAASLRSAAQAKAKQEREERLGSLGLFEGWSGQGQAGAGFSSGNTREVSLVLGIVLQKEGLNTRHKLSGLIDYLRSNGFTTRQKFSFGYALNYKLADGMSLVTTLGWERDSFAGYARRFTESAGLGYRALNGNGMTLDLEAGPALRQTLYVYGEYENEFAGRGAFNFRWKLNDGMQFSQDATIVGGTSNTTLNSNTALTAKLNGKLSGRMSFNVQKEFQPQPGRESTDISSRASLVYDF